MKNIGFWGLVILSLAIIGVGVALRPGPIALSQVIHSSNPNAAWHAQRQQMVIAERRVQEEAQRIADEEARLLALPPAKAGEPHFVRIETPTYTYVGWAVDSVFQGEGTMYKQSGDVYKGQFKNGKYHGYGVCKWSVGSMYEGYWNNNLRDGQGKTTYASGITEEGTYIRDKRNGFFVTRVGLGYPLGMPLCVRLEGTYSNNVLQNGKCYDEKGRLIYEGPFHNNVPSNPYPSVK